VFSEEYKLIFLNAQIELRTEKGQTEVIIIIFIIIIILLRISGLIVAFTYIRKQRMHDAFSLLLLAHIHGHLFVLVFVLYHTGTFH
jgi:hypothetical protein